MLNKPRCHLCRKNHPLKYCQVFQVMSNEERRDFIVKRGYCLNCLAISHTRYWCESPHRCLVCESKHHTMIHRVRRTGELSSSFEEEAPNLKMQEELPIAPIKPNGSTPIAPRAEISKEEILSPMALILHELPCRQQYQAEYIAPLVRVELQHKGCPMWVNFLLDDKAEKSFIMRQVAEIFPYFSHDEENCGIFEAAPSYESQNPRRPLARLRLPLRDGPLLQLPTPTDDPCLIQQLKTVAPLAHPGFTKCREADGVIGGRTPAFILKSKKTPTNSVQITSPEQPLWLDHLRNLDWVSM